GFGLLTKIVQAAKEREFPAHAITDHGTASGVLQFHNLCRKAGVKPILGCEMYFVDDNTIKPRTKDQIQAEILPYDKETQKVMKERIKREDKIKKKRDHITILVKNEIGYQNLMHLVSDSHLIGAIEGGYNRMIGRADWALLEKYHEGLIAMSACTSGIIARPIIEGDGGTPDKNGLVGWQLGRERMFMMKDIFGDDFYIELMPIDMEDQRKANEGLIIMAKSYDVKTVATNDCHYISPNDPETHDILLCIQQNKSIFDEDKWTFDARDLWMKTRQEMLDSFLDKHPKIPYRIVEASLDNTLEVADKCNYTFPKCEPRLPNLEVKESGEYEEFLSWLESGSLLGLRDNLDEVAQQVIEEKEKEKAAELVKV
ncbi:MAG: PHP domain-containing protein, partial [Candidatus Izemoplasmatales bacterium]